MTESRSVGAWEWEKGQEMITKKPEETLGGDRCSHYLGCGDDFVGIYRCQNLTNCAI